MAEENKTYETKSKKRLQVSKLTSGHQKEWFRGLRQRILNGEKLAWGTANTPEEILTAMDIPLVVNQWWTAICAAKQMGPKFYSFLETAGYEKHLCSYCATAYACALDDEPENGPWGGLPKPSMIISFDPCPSASKIDELCAKKWGADIFYMPHTFNDLTAENNDLWSHWDEATSELRLCRVTQDLERLVQFLEDRTGKVLERERLNEVMRLSNEQNEWFAKARDLIARSRPAPVSVGETLGAIMQVQWHRGTQWAVDMAKMFYEEIEEMVRTGNVAVPNEKIRLMWLGRGLWYNLAFYQYFEEKYGAAFVWSQYLAIAADKYIRYKYEEDPLRALATRFNSGGFGGDWYVKECRSHGIDGIVYLISNDNCMNNAQSAELDIIKLERAGYPVLVLHADAANAETWNQDKMTQAVSEFIENRVIPLQKEKGII
ncbi:MAG: 2-hydroxyacyl-CoA dehydratase [Clostridiales bacterium]|nr:2-hydroxyacyl-CoA dehydratase [Clostridiales bacterium]